jgi:carbamoyltransferase
MGLAPYGDPRSSQTATFCKTILGTLVDVKGDGSLRLNLDYFAFTTSLRMVRDQRMEQLLGIARREPETELTQAHANLALAVQQVTEEVVLRMAAETQKLTGSSNLCMAGGVALNCVANGKLQARNLFREIYVQPAAGDAGGALGAALAGYWLLSTEERNPATSYDSLQNALLGSAVQPEEQVRLSEKHGAKGHVLPSAELDQRVAQLLSEGQIVGWVQGRMEWGPRALGNRTILGDPRRSDMQRRLNLAIKFREGFRPFAPAVLAEKAQAWFKLPHPAPYMLETAELQPALQNPLPSHLYQLPFADRLALDRGPLPAVTHLDYSARVQTVDLESHPRFHALLTAFDELTGCPILVNTSFNVRGEPIVRTADEAYIAFMRTDMDALVIEDMLYLKSEQPAWPEPRLTAEALHGTD